MSNLKIVDIVPLDENLTDDKEIIIYEKASETLSFKDTDGTIKKISKYYEEPIFLSNGSLKSIVLRQDGSKNILLEQWGDTSITGNGTFQINFLEEYKEKCHFLIVTRKSGSNMTSLKFIANALNKFDVIIEGNDGTVTLTWNSKGI